MHDLHEDQIDGMLFATKKPPMHADQLLLDEMWLEAHPEHACTILNKNEVDALAGVAQTPEDDARIPELKYFRGEARLATRGPMCWLLTCVLPSLLHLMTFTIKHNNIRSRDTLTLSMVINSRCRASSLS